MAKIIATILRSLAIFQVAITVVGFFVLLMRGRIWIDPCLWTSIALTSLILWEIAKVFDNVGQSDDYRSGR